MFDPVSVRLCEPVEGENRALVLTISGLSGVISSGRRWPLRGLRLRLVPHSLGWRRCDDELSKALYANVPIFGAGVEKPLAFDS